VPLAWAAHGCPGRDVLLAREPVAGADPPGRDAAHRRARAAVGGPERGAPGVAGPAGGRSAVPPWADRPVGGAGDGVPGTPDGPRASGADPP
jgi:hypothetical protein